MSAAFQGGVTDDSLNENNHCTLKDFPKSTGSNRPSLRELLVLYLSCVVQSTKFFKRSDITLFSDSLILLFSSLCLDGQSAAFGNSANADG